MNLTADAETSFRKVETLLTNSDTEQYFTNLLDASSETGIAVGEYSDAVYQAISASVDEADAVQFASDAVKLAKGGYTSLTTAVDVLTTAVNAYGFETDKAAHISDVLIMTQNAGKTTVDELGSSMGKVIPIAQASNVTIEELSAMYAVMTKNGIATAEAGTGIKAMLSELSKTGSGADKTLRAYTKRVYGVSMGFSDMQANGYTMQDVLKLLSESANESDQTLSDMFGSIEAGNAALTLFKDGGEEVTELMREMQEQSGATEEAYKIVSNSFSEASEKLKTRIDNVKIAIGEKFLPVLTDLVNKISDKVGPAFEKAQEWFGTFYDKAVEVYGYLADTFNPVFESLEGMFVRVKDALQPLIDKLTEYVGSGEASKDATNFLKDAIEFLSGALETLIGWITKAIDWMTEHKGVVEAVIVTFGIFYGLVNLISFGMTAFNTITTIATTVTTAFGVAMTIITSPITWVIAGITLLIAAIALCVKHWDTIKETASNVWNSIKEVWGKVADWFKTKVVDPIKKFFSDMGTAISNAVKSPVNHIISNINTFLRGLNKIKIPDWVPGIGGAGFNISEIPQLAEGGVLKKGQLGLLEGNGAEAVVPLDQNQKWISAVAEDMSKSTMGNNEQTQRIIDLLEMLVDVMPDAVHDAVADMKLNINNREFARMVKAVG